MKWLLFTPLAVCWCLSGTALGGDGFWETNGPFGGSVREVLYDFETPGLCYVAAGNGLFRSEDGGQHWERSCPDVAWPEINCNSIAVCPESPKLVYASFYCSGFGQDLYRSSDGGVTWDVLQAEWLTSRTCGFVREIACDPRDPEHLCVAFERTSVSGDVHRTADGGQTWTKIYRGRGASSVCIDPNDSRTIWVMTAEAALRTRNAGQTWNAYAQGLPNPDWNTGDIVVSPSDSSRVFLCNLYHLFLWLEDQSKWFMTDLDALEVDVCHSDPNRLYACSNTNIYTSSDGGIIWRVAAPGRIGRHIAVSPDDPEELLVADLTGILHTTDGCRTLAGSSEGLLANDIEYLAAGHSADSLVACGGDILASTTNGGENWMASNQSFYMMDAILGQDPRRPTVLYATTGLSFDLYVTYNMAMNWRKLCALPSLFDSSLCITVDPTDCNTIYMASEGLSLYRTRDAGRNWDRIEIQPDISTLLDDAAVAIDPLDPGHVMVCASRELYVSRDDCGHFEKCVAIPLEPTFVHFDPTSPWIVYAGDRYGPESYSGGLCKSDDGGVTWAWLATPVTRVYTMVINPNDSDELYISGYRGVHYTRDGGDSWTSLSTEGLQCQSTTAILVDFGEAGNTIYAAGSAVFSYYHAKDNSPHLALSTNQSSYAPGDVFQLSCDLDNPGGAVMTDFAAWFVLPNGSLLYVPSLSSNYAPFYSGPLPGGFNVEDYLLFQAPILHTLPSGTYYAYTALFQQGTRDLLCDMASVKFSVVAMK